MKFLHTADWHVGRTIRNRSRIDEHRAVFAEIIDIAKQEDIDAVLVAGDVFHERRPPLEAQELVATTMAELARANISVVMIPGNHDEPFLLRTLKPLGELVQVYVVTHIGEDLNSLIVSIPGRDGKEHALVGCFPYLHPHQVLTTAAGANMTEADRLITYQSTAQDYLSKLQKKMAERDSYAVSLVLAHVYIAECKFGGGEWRSSVFPINAAFLPPQVQYVALGHMHEPQVIPGTKSQARYAGSILQMDFGERDQKKSVCLIEAHPGKPATITEIPLTKGKWLLRRTGTAEALLAQAPEFSDAWVEVVVSLEKLDVDLVNKIRALPEVISLRFEEPQEESARNGETEKRGSGDRPAVELFRDYYKVKKKTEPEPQLVALFERLYQEASTASDEP